MISVSHLNVEFSARPLFSDATFVINDKEHVALTGKNGAGKSTLLKILAGWQQPTSGEVAVPNGHKIGYLPQTMNLTDNRTIREEAALAFSEVKAMEKRIDQLGEELARRKDYDSPEYAELIARLSHETERMKLMGGHSWEAVLERTLTGLGFAPSDLDRPTGELSGGWRMRVELAKILLAQPDVLLLDEPTNHLDILSIEWLEKFLAHSTSSVILVSHDRTFLNHVTTRTLDIDCGRIIDYKVKYDDYIRLREERREAQLRAYENQQKEIADIKDFIERFRYKATKAVQVQSRIKQLEKIVPIEVDETDRSCLHLKFPPCSRSGDFPVICNEVAKSYGSHQVFSHVSLSIRRGEKVAFVGKNGEGKSTLVKCIMGEIPFTGELKIGHNVEIGYFAQNEAQMLDETISVWDTIDRVARGEIRTRINDLLGAFLFGGEAAEKPVKVLSGGERSRLAMLRLLLQPVNLLILDEPTNHLDMQTKDVLKEAINNFDGTAIIVSHDRDFLDGLTDTIYEFSNGKVKEHLGGIYRFLETKEMESLNELDRPIHKDIQTNTQPQPVNQGAVDWEERKAQRRIRNKLEKTIKECENVISETESAIKILEDQLSTSEGAANPELATRHARLCSQLDKAMEEWTTASEKLEAMDALS